MYDDISSTVIMLRQFDQCVPAHKIKVPREDLEIQRIPPLVKNFIFFANRNSSKNMQFKIKINTVYTAPFEKEKTPNYG